MPERKITLNIRKFDKSERNNVTGGAWKRKLKYQDAIEKPAIVVQVAVEDPNSIVPAAEIDEVTVIFTSKNKKIDDYVDDEEPNEESQA